MTVFLFDDCELDLDKVELRVRRQQRSVQPQVFDVLAFLVLHRHRLVSKTEVLDAVWHHRFVTESALSSRIKSARRAIGDDGRAQRLIRTVHGRGFRFVGDVRVALGADRSVSVPTSLRHARSETGRQREPCRLRRPVGHRHAPRTRAHDVAAPRASQERVWTTRGRGRHPN